MNYNNNCKDTDDLYNLHFDYTGQKSKYQNIDFKSLNLAEYYDNYQFPYYLQSKCQTDKYMSIPIGADWSNLTK